MIELSSIGYDPEEYGLPVINRDAEEHSLLSHIDLYSNRVNRIEREPSDFEVERVVNIALMMCKHNKYQPNSNYKSSEYLQALINSSLVSSSKSPGHPYCADGLTTNGKVIEHFGSAALAEKILNEWDQQFDLKVFIKTEPHKVKKLKAKMLRIITGLPLHKMVKHQALFRELNEAMVDNWKNSPIVYPFSPLVPGDTPHLFKRFHGRTVNESDKTNWDFNYFPYIYRIACKIVQGLAVKPATWSQEQFNEYLQDVSGAFTEMYVNSRYRLSNGKIVTPAFDGIMKSGWYLTITCNSLAQLILDILCKIRMGFSDDEICSPTFQIIVGGDDVLQSFPVGFNQQEYFAQMGLLGIDLKMNEIKNHKSMDGAEFFSNRFELTRSGVVNTHPVRMAKHVYGLTTTKQKDLADALISHMANHVFSARHFKFFEDMYIHFNSVDHTTFPLSKLVQRRVIIARVRGYELFC